MKQKTIQALLLVFTLTMALPLSAGGCSKANPYASVETGDTIQLGGIGGVRPALWLNLRD